MVNKKTTANKITERIWNAYNRLFAFMEKKAAREWTLRYLETPQPARHAAKTAEKKTAGAPVKINWKGAVQKIKERLRASGLKEKAKREAFAKKLKRWETEERAKPAPKPEEARAAFGGKRSEIHETIRNGLEALREKTKEKIQAIRLKAEAKADVLAEHAKGREMEERAKLAPSFEEARKNLSWKKNDALNAAKDITENIRQKIKSAAERLSRRGSA